MKNDEVDGALNAVNLSAKEWVPLRSRGNQLECGESHFHILSTCSKLSHANSTNGPFHLSNVCGDIFVEVSSLLVGNSITLKLLMINIK